MSLKEQLNADLRNALRANDETRKTTIRLVLAAMHNAEIESGKELDDATQLGILGREIKIRRESIDEFRKAGREDLVPKQEAELAVLGVYQPEQLTRNQIVAAAQAVIHRVGAKGPQDKGRVMGPLVGELRGKADGGEINAVVTELLSRLS